MIHLSDYTEIKLPEIPLEKSLSDKRADAIRSTMAVFSGQEAIIYDTSLGHRVGGVLYQVPMMNDSYRLKITPDNIVTLKYQDVGRLWCTGLSESNDPQGTFNDERFVQRN